MKPAQALRPARLYGRTVRTYVTDAVPTTAAMAASSLFSVLPYAPEHREGVIRVCLRTGDAGTDATASYPTLPQLLGLRYVVPYLDQLAYVLCDDATGAICGYTLATLVIIDRCVTCSVMCDHERICLANQARIT